MFRHRCYFDLAGGLGMRVPPMSLPFCSRHLVSLTARRGFPWSRPVVDSFSAKEDAVIRWNSVPVGWQQIAKAILLPAVLMIYLARSAFGDVQYAITDLGTLGGTYSAAFGINNSGEVVGQAITSDGQAHAFVYNSGVPMQDLGTLGGTVSCAFGVNQGGQVVGYSSMTGDDGYVHPFLYNGSGSMQDLGTLNAMADVACAINNSGEVVGGPDVPDKSPGGYSSGPGHAFLCNGTGPLQDIGTLNGFPWSSAEGVNDSGQVVGVDPYYSSRAFLYSGGACRTLGSLGGQLSAATAINNAGEIVGWSQVSTPGYGHAFKYSGNGPMQVFSEPLAVEEAKLLASTTAGRSWGARETPSSTAAAGQCKT